MQKKVLIGSDSQSLIESVRIILQEQYLFFSSRFSQDLKLIIEKERIDLVILDLGYPPEAKISLLYELVSSFSDLPFLLLVESYHALEWVEIFRGGNVTIVKIPAEIFDLGNRIENILRDKELEEVKRKIINRAEVEKKYLITENTPKFTLEVIKLLEKAISYETSVLISGERGTGRELAAKIIHYNGSRNKMRFLHLNCNGLPQNDFIKILVGKRDEYSAKNSLFDMGKAGYISHMGGTIYFNEIGCLDPKLQRMVIELIDHGGIRAEDGKFVGMDFRIIASTSMDLFSEVKRDHFDQRLFYKISILPIHIAPLRERREEVPLLIKAILKEGMEKFMFGEKSFSSEAMERLKNYLWPGNLAELESVVLRSALLSGSEIISSEEISYYFGRVFKGSKEYREAPEEKEYLSSEEFERREEEEIKESEGKEDLVMGLAHEIKNPLVAIKTFAHLLPEKFDDPEFRDNFYKVVNQDIDRIDSLVERILEYQRVLALPLEVKSLPEIINNLIPSFEKELKDLRITVFKDFDPNLSQIHIESNRLTCAFKNIISRLIKEAGEDSEIRFLTRAKSLMSGRSGDNSLNGGIEVVISARDTKNKEEELFFSNEKHLGIKGIEIFLAEQLIKSERGKISINTIDNKGIEVIILLPGIEN